MTDTTQADDISAYSFFMFDASPTHLCHVTPMRMCNFDYAVSQISLTINNKNNNNFTSLSVKQSLYTARLLYISIAVIVTALMFEVYAKIYS